MKLLYRLGPAVFLLALFSCTTDQLVKADNLERELLITWVALERNDFAVAKSFNQSTQQSWAASREQYKDVPLTASQQRSVTLIHKWMDNLDFCVRYGQRDNALISIQLIQHEIRTVRPRSGQPHPADLLYSFYLDWQEVREVSHDQMMCLLDWNEFEGLYELADKEWHTYQNAQGQHSDGLTFPGLGSNSLQAEQGAVALSKSLDEFAESLREGNHTLTRAPGDKVHRLFIDYLAVILEYPGIEKALK